MSPGGALMPVGDNGSHRNTLLPMSADEWTLIFRGEVERPCSLSIQNLQEMASVERAVDITCVSSGKIYRPAGAQPTFTGIDFPALASKFGLRVEGNSWKGQTVRFISRAPGSCGPVDECHDTAVELSHCMEPGKVMLVWAMDDAPLTYTNGGPLRAVVADRYFYKSLKWLSEIQVLAKPLDDCRGTWERYAGYHNIARIDQEERFEPFLRVLNDQHLPTEVADPHAAFVQMLREGDLSRLVSAKLELLIPNFASLPGWSKELCFVKGEFKAAFRGADFQRHDFRQWNLSSVNFSLARFIEAQCANEDGSQSASFRECDFEGALFWGATLCNVDMSGAYLGGTQFYKPTGGMPADVQGLRITDATGASSEVMEWLLSHGAVL